MTMTSSKPYLIRALYDWILDNETTPYILVDATADHLMIPEGVANDGKVVLNLSPSAIERLEMELTYISFSARFNGVSENIYCPIDAVMAIYARENGEGMMFPLDETASADSTEPATTRKAKGPSLKVIK